MGWKNNEVGGNYQNEVEKYWDEVGKYRDEGENIGMGGKSQWDELEKY